MLKNKDGDAYLLLAQNKRVTVRKYKGSILIDIREVSGRSILLGTCPAMKQSLILRDMIDL